MIYIKTFQNSCCSVFLSTGGKYLCIIFCDFKVTVIIYMYNISCLIGQYVVSHLNSNEIIVNKINKITCKLNKKSRKLR